MEKSAVHIEWIVDGHDTTTSSGGVVCHKDSNKGLYILSTAHQLKPFIDNNDATTLLLKNFEIRVTFFDRGPFSKAGIFRLDMFADLTLIEVPLTKQQFSNPPFPLIQPALFSKETLYPKQLSYAVHHPTMIRIKDDAEEQLFFQQTTGRIVDLEYPVPGQPTRVHYEIDLVMSGSSGGPIFDQNTNKVLGIISGAVCGTTHEGLTPTKRHFAISLETIRGFLQGINISV